MTVLANVPLWVWPLFVLLLIVGLRATRPRRAPLALVLALPLLGVLSLRSLSTLPDPMIVWPIWAIAILLGTALGHRLQTRWLISRDGPWLQLRGEWLTLATAMLIFWSNFAGGVMRVLAADALSGAPFQTGFALVLGLCAGTFLGRAIRSFRA
ncbi:hypothetical protein E7681_13425 [Thalassobius vesicularis]|uniref:DUF1453 domain-containing protein n=1 Tax=Thalassobius vesicularis TaxID=1294297 RepID=A0A4S3M776_9RHOB|nr:hypothetical protein [Thalassobius vesicularis]THD72920.1 hypothetical protein E7681_13425 [Thalassobius vesicularis]